MQGNSAFYAYQREAAQTQNQEAEDTLLEALKTLLVARQQQNNRLYFDTLSDVVKLSLAMTGNKALSREQTLDSILMGMKQRESAKTADFYGSKDK